MYTSWQNVPKHLLCIMSDKQQETEPKGGKSLKHSIRSRQSLMIVAVCEFFPPRWRFLFAIFWSEDPPTNAKNRLPCACSWATSGGCGMTMHSREDVDVVFVELRSKQSKTNSDFRWRQAATSLSPPDPPPLFLCFPLSTPRLEFG